MKRFIFKITSLYTIDESENLNPVENKLAVCCSYTKSQLRVLSGYLYSSPWVSINANTIYITELTTLVYTTCGNCAISPLGSTAIFWAQDAINTTQPTFSWLPKMATTSSSSKNSIWYFKFRQERSTPIYRLTDSQACDTDSSILDIAIRYDSSPIPSSAYVQQSRKLTVRICIV